MTYKNLSDFISAKDIMKISIDDFSKITWKPISIKEKEQRLQKKLRKI